MTTLDGPRLAPASGGPAKQLIVLVHGYGANGQDLIGLGSQWAQALPDAAFVSPDAPERCPGTPGGFQWFPLTRIDPDELDRGVAIAAPFLDDFIDAELEKLELEDENLALVGFSQGTMMSLHVGLRRQHTPAAIVGYSGALTSPQTLPGEILSRPPVLLVHGDGDEVIPVAALSHAKQGLEAASVSVKTHVSQGIGHGIAPDGLSLGEQFLAETLNF